MMIALIDDDVEDIDFMGTAVKDNYPDCQCITFTDCETALAALVTTIPPPDYIFVDVNMNKTDGEQCLQDIRKISHLRESRIVMMSASMHIYEKGQRRFLDSGAFAIVEKPESLDGYGKMFVDIIGHL